MLDTIAPVYDLALGNEESKHWKIRHTYESPLYTFETWELNTYIDGTAIKATYNPPNGFYPNPRLKIEVSLPSLLYGNNIAELTDIAEVHAAALVGNKMLQSIPGIPHVDLRDGLLARIDVCHNHHLEGSPQDYIKAMFNLDYLDRDTKPYPHQGVQYKSKVITTKFYDQYRKRGTDLALNVLRQETTIRKPFYIGRLMDTHFPTLRDVTKDWVIEMLEKDLHKLHLDHQMILPLEKAQDELIEAYGPNKGNRLYGYWRIRQSASKDHLLSIGCNKQAIYRNDKAITDAGIALTSTDGNVALPPLRINFGDIKM